MSKEIEISNNQANISIEKIRSYMEAMNLASNLTNAEANQFIEIASAYGLNPFKREIYATKYGNNFSIIVGFETYLKRAERSGKLAGWSVETSGNIDWNNIMSSSLCATITIHRKDWNYPFIHSVYFAEYVQRTKDGVPNKFWREKPYTMIKKVAMAQGFRLCFSDENGGLPYTSEEIATEQVMDAIILESSTPEQQTPAKRKYTKKADSDEIVSMKAKIHTAVSLDDLKRLWEENRTIRDNKELVQLVSDKKKHIQDTELMYLEEQKKQLADTTSLLEKMDQEATNDKLF